METYKNELKLQNIFLTVCILILAALSLWSFLSAEGVIPFLRPSVPDSHWQDMWLGFCAGASWALMLIMVYALVRNLVALQDESKLKKLYVKEKDERTKQIYTAARAAGCQCFLLLGIVAIIVAGYFSAVVSLTILGCVFSLSIVCLLFKLYYGNKF